MSSLKKIAVAALTIALIVAVAYFAPQLGVSLFLSSLIGATVIALGVTLINLVLGPSLGGGASQESGKVNVKIGEPIRWICAGRVRQGGGVLFAEFDPAGNLWYLIVHSDSILTELVQVYFDDLPIELDGSGFVLNEEFRLKNNKKKDVVKSAIGGAPLGTIPYAQMWTTTYSEDDPTPPAISALAAAFPSKWTSDHKLVGTTYSVVMMKSLKLEDRSKIYKWRGVLGLGEPAVSIVGEWSNVYDPRDVTQTLGDRTTYKPTNNAELIWAWFRTHRYGRKKSEASINWDMIAEQADICDEVVTGLAGTTPRYGCSIAVPENKQRVLAEQEIMLTMDGQIVFDDDGKTWVRAGKYAAPSLTLTRNRDIVAMESVEAQNGESETQGVVVRYTDPGSDYTTQPSAAWFNPNYYVEGETPQFLTVDILSCTDHNQAMRLAKGIGLRSQPLHKIAPVVGLRGLRARQERFISLNYDNTFAGDYEIATSVEVDAAGIFCGFGCVPVDADRWTLLTGEEKPKPVTTDSRDDPAFDAATVTLTNYYGGKVRSNFDTYEPRDDLSYEFQYANTVDAAADVWSDMTVNIPDGIAESDVIVEGNDYSVRHRAVSPSGAVTDWVYESDTTAPPLTDATQIAIYNSWIVEVAEGTPIASIASDGTLTIDNHTRRYSDGHVDVAITGDTISTGLSPADVRSIGYDDPDRVGGAVTFNLYTDDNVAHVSDANPGRHYVGYFTVPASGSTTGGGGSIPGGRFSGDPP